MVIKIVIQQNERCVKMSIGGPVSGTKDIKTSFFETCMYSHSLDSSLNDTVISFSELFSSVDL